MMSEATWALLRRVFLSDYARFAKQIEILTGSADLADDAMQETYLRLAQGGDIDQVASPRGYLRQMVFNAARKIMRSNRVRSRFIDVVETLDLEIADETPGAERQIDGRSDIAALRDMLRSLPTRRRNIFILAMIDDVPLAEIAERHRLGVRMVQIELKRARDDITARFREINVMDFAKARADASKE